MASKKSESKKVTKKVVKKVPKKRGRPAAYTHKLGEEICNRISEGESLLQICRDPKMPARSVINRWLLKLDEDGKHVYPGFRDNYAQAMELRADHAFDEINEIADETPGVIKSTAEKKSGAMANAQRLRVDARKWTAARMFPKKYSERHILTSEDKDGATVPIGGNVIQFASQTEKEDEPDS